MPVCAAAALQMSCNTSRASGAQAPVVSHTMGLKPDAESAGGGEGYARVTVQMGLGEDTFRR